MLNELQTTLDILNNLNLKCKQEKNIEIISQSDFNEQLENLDDFVKMHNDMKLLLKDFENCKNENFSLNVSKLLKLHIKFCDYEWHINEIHELLRKMIGSFPEDDKS